MLISRSTGLLLAGGLATAIALLIAWPVAFAPAQMVYGREIVGHHPDVPSAIVQLADAGPLSLADEPLVTLPGRWIAQVIGPVAALNVLVLLTFPLTAMATYALARYLHGSHGAALIAALVFTFSPLRLAQAAYHPFVIHTEWLPLFLLALVALVERVSVLRGVALVVALVGLALSSLDLLFVGVFLAPVVLLAFWLVRPDADRNLWPLIGPAAIAAAIAAACLAIVWRVEPSLFTLDPVLSSHVGDIRFFRARWWAYFTPAVDHPAVGERAASFLSSQGINFELVEEQLYLGYSFLVLSAIASVVAVAKWKSGSRLLVALVGVGLAAAIISVGPSSGSCDTSSFAPACLAARVFPVFQAYARFGLAVGLIVAVTAGFGAVSLARGSSTGRAFAIVLLALGAFEYFPLPARAHDVLPTEAHRWLATQSGGKILDCYPANQADQFLARLMGRDIALLGASVPTCANPELGQTLAAQGFTEVLVRGGNAASHLLSPLPPGIEEARTFRDSTLYTVAATLPPVLTVSTVGFYGYEHQDDDWWRWMGAEGSWTIRNTTSTPQRASLSVVLLAYGAGRTLTVSFDDGPPVRVPLSVAREAHVLGPWTLAPGDHVLKFSADGDPTRPSDVSDSRDRRALTVAFRGDRWSVGR